MGGRACAKYDLYKAAQFSLQATYTSNVMTLCTSQISADSVKAYLICGEILQEVLLLLGLGVADAAGGQHVGP